MQILFTTGRTWLSRTICDVLDEPVSHVAVLCGDTVFHSNLLGARLETERDFMKSHSVVARYTVPDAAQRILDVAARRRRAAYDFGALLFLGVTFAVRRYLKIPMPRQNLWQTTGMFICTELVTEVIDGSEDSLCTPYGLLRRLVRSNQTS